MESLEHGRHSSHDPFLLTVPRLDRLETLTIRSPSSDCISELTELFGSPAPLLQKLAIHFYSQGTRAVIESTMLNGDFSSSRELRLSRILTSLPWQDLSNLATFDFPQGNKTSVTQLLDFFERAPLLHKIKLLDSLPHSSDAPSKRVVFLPRLRLLKISAQPAHSILLNHLRTPTGAL